MQTRTLWLAGTLIAFGPAVLAADPGAPATPPAAAATQTYTLHYKFKAGDVNYYKMTMDSNGTIGGPGGQTLPIKQHMVFFYHQAVTAVNATDGSATLTTKYDSADLSITTNGQTMPGSDTVADQLKSRTLTTTVSPTGKTTSIKSDGADGAAMPGMDFSKLANFQGTSLLPDGPLKIGDNWKGSVDLNGAMGAQMAGLQATVQSTLTSVDTAAGKTTATINQTTTGQASPSDSTVMGMAMSVAGKINGTGVLKFDTDAGGLLSQTATMNLNMTLTPKGDAGGAGPIPVQFTITTDLQKVDASAVPKAAPVAAPAPAATTAPAAAPVSYTKPGPGRSYLYGRIF